MKKIRWTVWVVNLSILGLAVWSCFGLQFRSRVFAEAKIGPRVKEKVYAAHSGFAVARVQYGSIIEKGELLAEIQDEGLLKKKDQLNAKLGENRIRLEGLRILVSTGEKNSGQIEFLEQRCKSIEAEIRELERALDKLVMRAGHPGVFNRVSPSPFLSRFQQESEVDSHGSFQTKGGGKFLRKGQLLGLICDPDQRIGVARVDHTQRTFVHPGQQVKIYCPHHPEPVSGEVTSISERTLETGQPGSDQEGYFVVAFSLTGKSDALPDGVISQVVFLGPEKSVAQMISSYFRRTFRI